jgi:hypothetical protein
MSTAKYLKTTQAHLNLPGYLDSVHVPSISMCATITSENTSEKA